MGIAKEHHYGDAPWQTDTTLFADVASNPKRWLGTAEDHLYAAQILFAPELQRQAQIELIMSRKIKTVQISPSLSSQYFLFCALAMENSFKAVICSSNQKQVARESYSTGKLPPFLLGHDLLDLAERAGFTFDSDGEYYLRFLSRYGIWSGKYPLPVKNADNTVTVKQSDGEHYLMGGYMPKNLPKYLEYAIAVQTWCSEEANKNLQNDEKKPLD